MMKKNISIFKGIIFIFISIYLAYTFDNALSNMIIKLPFGWVVSSIILRIFITLAFARGFQLLITAFKPSLNIYLWFIIGIPIGFGVSFITPIYSIDYSNQTSNQPELNLNELNLHINHKIQTNGKAIIIAFFTTSCSHCKIVSQKLGSMSMAGKTPKIHALFPGTKEDTDLFIKENKAQYFSNQIVNDQDYFIRAAEGVFPSVFLVDTNSKIIKHWTGELSYPTLDYISKHK
jgi:thiol-disulfide isomerase/thioredoxin